MAQPVGPQGSGFPSAVTSLLWQLWHRSPGFEQDRSQRSKEETKHHISWTDGCRTWAQNPTKQGRLPYCRGVLPVPPITTRCHWWTNGLVFTWVSNTQMPGQQSHLQKCNTHKYPSHKYQVVLKPLLKLSHTALRVDISLTVQFLFKAKQKNWTFSVEHEQFSQDTCLNIDLGWTLKKSEKALIPNRRRYEKRAMSESFLDYVLLPGCRETYEGGVFRGPRWEWQTRPKPCLDMKEKTLSNKCDLTLLAVLSKRKIKRCDLDMGKEWNIALLVLCYTSKHIDQINSLFPCEI